MEQGFIGGFYQASVWVMRLAYINILWIAFTIVGLLVLGIGPSTTAMFAVTQKWLIGEKEIAIFSTFWESYRNEFVQSNILVAILMIIGWFLFIDYRILIDLENIVFAILSIVVLSFIMIYIFICFFIFPVLVHYKLKTLQYLKQTFLIVVSHPFRMALTGISIGLLLLLYYNIPALIPFFAGSLTCITTMYMASRVFKKVDSIDS